MQFQYSYPLGTNSGEQKDAGQEFMIYVEEDTLDINRIVVKDPSTMEQDDPFTIYALQPVTQKFFAPEDMEFTDVSCQQATPEEQKKLDDYIDRFCQLLTQQN